MMQFEEFQVDHVACALAARKLIFARATCGAGGTTRHARRFCSREDCRLSYRTVLFSDGSVCKRFPQRTAERALGLSDGRTILRQLGSAPSAAMQLVVGVYVQRD